MSMLPIGIAADAFIVYNEVTFGVNNVTPPELYPDMEFRFIDYKVFRYKSGLSALKKYSENKDVPRGDAFLYFFLETNVTENLDSPDETSSSLNENQKKAGNYFGTICRAIIGIADTEEMLRSFKNGNVYFYNRDFGTLIAVHSIRQLCEYIAEGERDLDKDTHIRLFEDAIRLEMFADWEINTYRHKIYNAFKAIPNMIQVVTRKLNNIRPRKENYDYYNCYFRPMQQNLRNGYNAAKVEYAPLLPVISASGSFSKPVQFLASDILKSIQGGAEVLLKNIGVPAQLVFEFLLGNSRKGEEEWFGGIVDTLFTNLSELLSGVVSFVNAVGKLTEDMMASLNAFILGVLDGIVSLIQMILWVLRTAYETLISDRIVPDPISVKERRLSEIKEFLEDVIDVLKDKIIPAFQALLKFLLNPTHLFRLLTLPKIVVEQRFLFIFIHGSIVFEIIAEAVLLYFTRGAGNAAKALDGIRRLVDKLEQLGKRGTDMAGNLAKQLANNAADLYRWIVRQMDELLEALKNGKFIEWLRGKIITLFGNPVDDIPPLSKTELDWMGLSKIFDDLGGKILNSGQLKKLRGILDKKGIRLILEDDIDGIKKLFKPVVANGIPFDNVDDLFRYMRNESLVGGFDASTMQMILPKKYTLSGYQNPSQLTSFHELAHVRHCEELGVAAYLELPKWQREQYVWNQIWANKKKWTKAELELSLWNVNQERNNFKLPPLKVKI